MFVSKIYSSVMRNNYVTKLQSLSLVCGMRILKISLNLLAKLDLKWLFDLISETSAFEAKLSMIIITMVKFSF